MSKNSTKKDSLGNLDKLFSLSPISGKCHTYNYITIKGLINAVSVICFFSNNPASNAGVHDVRVLSEFLRLVSSSEIRRNDRLQSHFFYRTGRHGFGDDIQRTK